MLCFPSYTMYLACTFQRPSNSYKNESLLSLLYDGLWKVKVKYIVLCLNAAVNSWTEAIISPHSFDEQVLDLQSRLSRINPMTELLLVKSKRCVGQRMLWPCGRYLLSRMQV